MPEHLRFVTLPKLFRLIGSEYIPTSILQSGYRPEEGPQISVFGDVSSLADWRSQMGLSEEAHPIHQDNPDAIHIDLYGEEAMRLSAEERVEDMLCFARSRRTTSLR